MLNRIYRRQQWRHAKRIRDRQARIGALDALLYANGYVPTMEEPRITFATTQSTLSVCCIERTINGTCSC